MVTAYLVILAVSALCAFAGYFLAISKGRRPVVWAALSFVFGPVPILVLLYLGQVGSKASPANSSRA